MADLNGEANANSTAIGSWEIWRATFIGDDQVQFKAANGKYLVAEKNGDANANRAVASTWETFTILKKEDGRFAFKSYHGKWLSGAFGALNAKDLEAYTAFQVEPWYQGKKAGLLVSDLFLFFMTLVRLEEKLKFLGL